LLPAVQQAATAALAPGGALSQLSGKLILALRGL
jgi:hypothetical protein